MNLFIYQYWEKYGGFCCNMGIEYCNIVLYDNMGMGLLWEN